MPSVRAAREGDLAGILAIYNDVIATSTAVYTSEPATLAERGAWFSARRSQGFPVLVAAEGGEVLGLPRSGSGGAPGRDIATRSNTPFTCAVTCAAGASGAFSSRRCFPPRWRWENT